MKNNNFNIIISIILLIPLFMFNYCGSKKTGNNKLKSAENLNKKAVALIQTWDTTHLNEAIYLLDSAIAIQPDFLKSYYNKVSVLNVLKREKEVYSTLKEIEKLTPNNPFIEMQIGMSLEKIGLVKEAHYKFLNAEKLFKNTIDTFNLNKKNKSIYLNLLQTQAINMKLIGNDSISDNYFDKAISFAGNYQLKNIITIYKNLKRYSFFNGQYESVEDSISSNTPPEIFLKEN